MKKSSHTQPTSILRYVQTIIFTLIPTVLLPAQSSLPENSPNVYCFSGSPLLLQVNIEKPDQNLQSISIESDSSYFFYKLAPITDPLQLYVNPFLSPGIHNFEIVLKSAKDEEKRNLFQAGFVDFVWGRDNLSFGNNSQFTSVIGSFGEVLTDWIEERFGHIDENDRVLTIDYMYSLFGSNTGLCYAFAATEVRYWRWPELLPKYYKTTHKLRGNIARYQRDMYFLQFDIVFNHFFANSGYMQIQKPMNIEEISNQLKIIEKRIGSGEPVTVGFAGEELHHSMLVFGFIRNLTANTFDLLVANNWKNDEKLNIHSRDAEIIRFFLNPTHEGPIVQWLYEDGKRKRSIDRMFVVDVQREPYEHNRSLFDTLISELREKQQEEGHIRVIVEGASGARIVKGERSTGRMRSRIFNELEEVWYEKVGKTYRFSYPADSLYELEIADTDGVRVLYAAPDDIIEDDKIPHIRVSDDAEGTEIRRFVLPSGAETEKKDITPSGGDT